MGISQKESLNSSLDLTLNTEEVGLLFFFIGEYRRIIFMIIILSLIFFGANQRIFFYVKIALLRYLIVLVRATLPRLRYDKLIDIAWKRFLPITLNYLGFVAGTTRLFTIYQSLL